MIRYIQRDGNQSLVPVYIGKITTIMPKLLTDRYTPLSIPGIIEQRILAWQTGERGLIDAWTCKSFDSGDGIMYHPDGRIKIVPNSETLRNVNSLTKLNWKGAQELPEGTFDKTQGYVFSRNEVREFANKPLTITELINNPLWLALVRDDKELLEAYAYQIYSRMRNPHLMSVHIDDISDFVLGFEAERFCNLSRFHLSSNLNADKSISRLDFNGGHLIGIPPKREKSRRVLN